MSIHLYDWYKYCAYIYIWPLHHLQAILILDRYFREMKKKDIHEKTKKSGSIPRNACVACETKLCVTTKKVWLPDRQTDAAQSDPYVPLCITGDTTMTICFIKNFHKSKACLPYKYATSLRRLQSCLYTSQSTWEHRCVNVSSYEKKTYIP